jgi:hypothetical protein
MRNNYNKEGLKKRFLRLGSDFQQDKILRIRDHSGNNVVDPDPTGLGRVSESGLHFWTKTQPAKLKTTAVLPFPNFTRQEVKNDIYEKY